MNGTWKTLQSSVASGRGVASPPAPVQPSSVFQGRLPATPAGGVGAAYPPRPAGPTAGPEVWWEIYVGEPFDPSNPVHVAAVLQIGVGGCSSGKWTV